MALKARMYRDEDDYWRLRAFLREVFLINNRQELSWQVARLDYWRFFGNVLWEHYALQDAIGLWETESGDLAAFFTPEGRGYVYLQVHPAHRSAALEADMLLMAEKQLAEPDGKGGHRIVVLAHQQDTLRRQVLEAAGYHLGDWPEHQFIRPLTTTPAVISPAPGYTVRALGDLDEVPARSWLSWRTFNPDAPASDYQGWEGYLDMQRCPLYRRDLDLVAVAPGGELAAFCTVWYDDVTRTGYFEPVGTAPEHQRRGLGKAILTEALRRLHRLGAVQANVAGYSEAANALYTSVMGPRALLYERWQKSL